MSDTTSDTALPKRRPKARRIRYLVLALIVAAAIYFIQDWIVRRQANVFIIDSRIASDMITVGAQEGGLVTDLTVATGDSIGRGEVLVRLDPRALSQQIAEVQAGIEQLESQKAGIAAEIDLETGRIGAAERTARARIAVTRARLKSAEALLAQAAQERQRNEDLLKRRVVSAQKLDDARAVEADLTARVAESQAAIVEAEAALQQARAETNRPRVLQQRLATLDAEQRAMTARREQLETRLADRDVPSMIDGIVDQTFIEIGEYVRPGQRLLMVHNPANVWVSANVKETELGRFSPGSRATVTVDAYPGRAFTGTVTWVAPAASSQFALLPNPNPSGNFTKVTQRVPVRIDLEGDRSGLRPGMMVEVAIHVSGD